MGRSFSTADQGDSAAAFADLRALLIGVHSKAAIANTF